MRLSEFNRRFPLLCAVTVVASVFVVAGSLQGFMGLLPLPPMVAGLAARLLTAVLLSVLIWRSGGLEWLKWPVAPGSRRGVILLTHATLLVLLYLFTESPRWGELVFGLGAIVAWLLQCSTTGLFEELFFRGLVLFLLLRAWGRTGAGTVRAGLAQTLLFGALHLVNALSNDLLYAVFYQVLNASLIGVGMAGLVICSRSIWPAVALHAALNATDLSWFFAGPDYSGAGMTPDMMFVRTGANFLLAFLPGLWLLKRTLVPETGPGAPEHTRRSS